MREIKFRAWNSIDKCMCDNATTLTNLRGFIKSKHYHPMQYTGLKDVNGEEVYEGDIVSLNHVNQIESSDIYYAVKWCHDECQWIIYHNEFEFYNLKDFDFWVIGNIHQNPELLEK